MREGKVRMENKRGSRGGNGIAGLLLFGGALAIAGVMAVASFVSHKNKAKGSLNQPNPQPNPQQFSFDTQTKTQDQLQIENETNQPLHSLQQSTAPTNHIHVTCDGTSHKTNITQTNNPSKLLHVQTSIMEEKIDRVPHLNCDTEVFYPKTVTLSNDISGFEEECLASLCNSHGSQAHMEPQDSLKSIESTEKETEDDAVLESGEEEDVISKAILNSKEEPACPAEQDFKGEAKTDSDADGSHSSATNEDIIVTPESTLIDKPIISMQLNHLPLELHSCELTSWLMPRLLLFLLLLLVLLINPYNSSASPEVLP